MQNSCNIKISIKAYLKIYSNRGSGILTISIKLYKLNHSLSPTKFILNGLEQIYAFEFLKLKIILLMRTSIIKIEHVKHPLFLFDLKHLNSVSIYLF